MGRQRLVIGAFSAVLAAGVLLLSGVFSGRPRADPLAVFVANAGVSPEQAEVGRLFAGFSTGNTAGVVHRLEAHVLAHDDDARVAQHLQPQRVADRLDEGPLGHRATSAPRTGTCAPPRRAGRYR